MSIYISMLRGINVGGQKKIKMADLRKLYESLGFSHVTSYVQSGNIVFVSEEHGPGKINSMLESQIQKIYGFPVHVIIRRPEDFKKIIEGNPFVEEPGYDSGRLYVTFLYKPLEEFHQNIEIAGDMGEEFSFGEEEIYLYCPNGYGRTKLNNNTFERKLNIPATTRNWNTVNALYDLVKEI